MRAVLDVNVLVAALLSPGGAPARLLANWLDGGFELVVSPALLSELQRALAYPKIRTLVSTDEARRLVRLLETGALLVRDPSDEVPVEPSDPDDRYLIALAAAAEAVLVTGDAALLTLRDRGAPVLPPAEFLREVDRRPPHAGEWTRGRFSDG